MQRERRNALFHWWNNAGQAADHWSPLRGVFPCVCTSSVVGGCCPAATHVCPPVWRIAWSGAGAPKVTCLLFPASPASLQTPPDGAEFAQNRQIPDRKAYIVRRGRVLAIENGKEKKPGISRVSSLDFVKAAHSLEVLHTFRELAFLENLISVFGLRK